MNTETFPIVACTSTDLDAAAATDLVERGGVLWLTDLGFELLDSERALLTPQVADGKSKNISYQPASRTVAGCRDDAPTRAALTAMLGRFSQGALARFAQLFPAYAGQLRPGLASYRPLSIVGRQTSARKDDRRLHVDAFASRPNQGWRILRLFTNIDPQGAPRVWNVGEPFDAYARRLYPRVPRYSAAAARWLKRLHVTKSLRTEYDHVMLQMHDLGKLDDDYQRSAPALRHEFPPQTSWICFTDQVLHAALAGQYLLEQTAYVPVQCLRHPERSPLRVLEGLAGHALA